MTWQIGEHHHPHGNHTHTHVHYRYPEEHDGSSDAHGWHDPAEAPQEMPDFDDTFGEEPMSERKPSGLVQRQLEEMFHVTPYGETLVVVPYVPGMLQVPEWLRGEETALIDVSASQYDYYDLMLRLFKHGLPFLVIEQDNVPTLEQIEEVTHCIEPICAISYDSPRGDIVEYYGDFGALGFICFKDPVMMAKVGRTLEEMGPVNWSRLDEARVYKAQLANGYRPHVHPGSVQHLHDYPGRRPSKDRNRVAANLTVLTCTIPEREKLLAINMESVRDQTRKVECHVIIADDGSLGTEAKYNRAANAAETDWIAPLDDDNHWLRHHVETIEAYFDKADVIYTRDIHHHMPHEDIDLSDYSQDQLIAFFAEHNAVDQSSAIRREMFEKVGGFRKAPQPRMFCDQDLWYRLAVAGARFKLVNVETWVYGTGAPRPAGYGVRP